MATVTAPSIKKNSRVIAAVDLRGVPEGMGGKVKVIDGFDWVRAWVEFDNGVWLGSVSADKLVPEKDWEEFQVRRVAEAAAAERRQEQAATTTEVAADAPAAADAGGGAGAASKVPSHLLERSAAARARIAAASAGEE